MLPAAAVAHPVVLGIRDPWPRRQMAYNEFWALKMVGLEVRQGEGFGIIGANGAGKRTLLEVVARVLRPTTGRVGGWPEPLLELGGRLRL